MRIRLALSALAVVMLASLGLIATAGAAPKAEPTVQLVGNVKINKDETGTVKAHYICPEGDDWHMWVSAKQTADGSRDDAITQEGAGFGQIAPTWLQSHPTTFTCNSKWQTQTFAIDKDSARTARRSAAAGSSRASPGSSSARSRAEARRKSRSSSSSTRTGGSS